jgi:predicted metal-dependent peptidase
MGEIVVQIDVSGSISKQELDYYNGHLQAILQAANPERVHVLYVDTSVQRHDTFECGEEFGLQFYSGGGTDMEAGFTYLSEQGIDPEVFVCLTDGYCSYNVGNAPSYPVVWCVSSGVVPPYGELVSFSLKE